VVVSPEGFVFHWDDSAAGDTPTVSISHVSQLADVPQPLVYTSMDAWHLYKPKLDPDYLCDIGGYEEPPPATVTLVDDSGAIPRPHPWQRFPRPRYPKELIFDTLSEAATNIAPVLLDSKNYTSRDYAPAAAEFVLRHFGVDVDNVDWHDANKARLKSKAFTHSTPFDPDAACAALRLAIVNNKVKHTAPTAIDQARVAAEQAFSRDLATRIQRHLKSSKPKQ
jgi:hypothetical protein